MFYLGPTAAIMYSTCLAASFSSPSGLDAAAIGRDVPPATALGRSLFGPSVADIGIYRLLLAVQLDYFRHIANVRRCRRHRVPQPRFHIDSDVRLHVEVPLLAFFV